MIYVVSALRVVYKCTNIVDLVENAFYLSDLPVLPQAMGKTGACDARPICVGQMWRRRSRSVRLRTSGSPAGTYTMKKCGFSRADEADYLSPPVGRASHPLDCRAHPLRVGDERHADF